MYCSNCGKKSNRRICEFCGVKKDKESKFCKWCGNELDVNAQVCPNCKEKIVDSKWIKRLIFIFRFVVIFLTVAGFILTEITWKFALFGAIVLVLCTPIIFNIIKKCTHSARKRKMVRTTLWFVIVLTFFISFWGMTMSFDDSGQAVTEHVITENEIIDVAVNCFHDEVKLRNEASFVLNDAQVFSKKKENDTDTQTFKIIIDYSAENGFGGMERETYIVFLRYDKETDQYYRISDPERTTGIWG